MKFVLLRYNFFLNITALRLHEQNKNPWKNNNKEIMKNTYFKFIDPVRAKEYVTFNNIIAPNINTIGNKNCKTLTSDWCFLQNQWTW